MPCVDLWNRISFIFASTLVSAICQEGGWKLERRTKDSRYAGRPAYLMHRTRIFPIFGQRAALSHLGDVSVAARRLFSRRHEASPATLNKIHAAIGTGRG
ncbi:hypothetical protein MSAN_02472400 [Mycena sanguinolenta]|uniref:Secreted protein n=1 Tax=Mycena sanguinolenta TaxID=230812 RepID=A0A8H6U556_9AGAR|nr:hypothetical protein MSAN_02472400 [Mycena sanguinolenta]